MESQAPLARKLRATQIPPSSLNPWNRFRMVKLSLEAFERIVAEALDELPDLFHSALENVAVVVQEEPGAELLREVDMEDDDDELLVLYVGIPLTEREISNPAMLPDRVYIFRQPILRTCDTVGEVRDEIRDTVVHELGHHMGLSDEEMPY
jgi:predicted Zn-dependent protease with MMP-like domain